MSVIHSLFTYNTGMSSRLGTKLAGVSISATANFDKISLVTINRLQSSTCICSIEHIQMNNGLRTTWDPGDNQSCMFVDAAKCPFVYSFMIIFLT